MRTRAGFQRNVAAGVRRRGAPLAGALLAAFSVSGASAWASDESTARSPRDAVAPNKSVTLDESVEQDSAGREAAGAQIAQTPATAVTTDAETPVGGAEQDDPPPAIARHRPVRARDADAASASTLNRPRQPWYRTGLGALAIVLALVGIALVVARRYLPTMRTADSAALQVVARTGVTPRHSVALVRLGRRLVLVGVSGDRMRRLSEVTDPLEIAEILAHTGAAATRGFDRFLVEEASAYGAPGGPESKTDPASAAVSPEVAGAMARRDRQRLPALANLKSRLQALRST